jgi:hypothetical protein
MQAKSLQSTNLLAPPRRERLSSQTRRERLRLEIRRDWLRREIAKTDAQLASLKGHVRSQLTRVAELERVGADTAAALDFLDGLQACQREQEAYRLRLARELAAT